MHDEFDRVLEQYQNKSKKGGTYLPAYKIHINEP